MMTVAAPQLDVTAELAALDDYLRYGTDEERSKGTVTRRAYLWTVERFLRYLDGQPPAVDAGREFVKSLEARGNSASTINRHIWALKSYFRFKGGLEFKIRGLKAEEHYPRFLSDEEWEKLLGTALGPVYNPNLPEYGRKRARLELALLHAYCGAGLRCAEAIKIKDTDIFDEGYVRVTRKGGREGYVPVEDATLQVFKEYLGTAEKTGRYVFPGQAPGSHMAVRTAQGIIKALCLRAGLDDVHVHTLRHTAGYQLRKLGSSERDIQDFLGHANIATTKIYTHLARADLRARLPKRFNHSLQTRMGV